MLQRDDLRRYWEQLQTFFRTLPQSQLVVSARLFIAQNRPRLFAYIQAHTSWRTAARAVLVAIGFVATFELFIVPGALFRSVTPSHSWAAPVAQTERVYGSGDNASQPAGPIQPTPSLNSPTQAPGLVRKTHAQSFNQWTREIAGHLEGVLGTDEPARLPDKERRRFHRMLTEEIAFASSVAEEEYRKYERRFEHLRSLEDRVAGALARGTLDPSIGQQWHEFTKKPVRRYEIPGLTLYDPGQLERVKKSFIAGTLTKREVQSINEMDGGLETAIRDLRAEQKRLDAFLATINNAGVSDWLKEEMDDSAEELEGLLGRLRLKSRDP